MDLEMEKRETGVILRTSSQASIWDVAKQLLKQPQEMESHAVEIGSPAPSRASAQAGRHLQGMQLLCQQDHLSHLSTSHSKHSVQAESSGIRGETSLALTLCRSIASELYPDFQKMLGACHPPIISLEKKLFLVWKTFPFLFLFRCVVWLVWKINQPTPQHNPRRQTSAWLHIRVSAESLQQTKLWGLWTTVTLSLCVSLWVPLSVFQNLYTLHS